MTLVSALRVATVMALAWCCVGASTTDAWAADLENLQGTWQCQSAILAGKAAPAENCKKMALTFKGDQVTQSEDPDGATVTLDASKTPATMDFKDKQGKIDLSIYTIEGDTFTFCMSAAESGKPRPASFESTKENGAMLMVLKKVAAGK